MLFFGTESQWWNIGSLGGVTALGAGINDAGEITGLATIATNNIGRAFLWDGTTMLDLGTLGGVYSDGSAINNSGQVTGDSWTSSGADEACF
jgi:probable HAF family extracellular repeat protein